MKKAILLTFIPILLWAIEHPPVEDTIIDLILRQDYSRAEVKAKTIGNSDSRDYYVLFIKNSRMVDYESYAIHGEWFEKSCQRYLKKLGKRWKKSDQLLYYRSMIKGMRGMAMIKRGSSLPGAMESKSSAKDLEKLLDRYPSDISLLQSVGLSKYYMATSLSWLPIAGGKPESGLRLIHKALAQEGLASLLTAQSMIWVHIDEKQYAKAEATANKILALYPDNTLALRGLQRAQFSRGALESANKTAEKLYYNATHRIPANRADQLSSFVVRTEIALRKGDKEKARKLCILALALPLSAEEEKISWVEKHRKTITKIKKDL